MRQTRQILSNCLITIYKIKNNSIQFFKFIHCHPVKLEYYKMSQLRCSIL